MHIVIAADSFKGCCSSRRAGELIARGVSRVFPQALIEIIPVGDGGEGTVEAVIDHIGGRWRHCMVTGPLGESISASYAAAGSTAVIEMASASGITLLQDAQKDPRITTTYGTGELLLDALEQGCTAVYVAVGGSGTNDGGAGAAQALGASFTDREGREIGFGGSQLKNIETVSLSNMHPKLKTAHIEILSDVTNPLCGDSGASLTYARQKGADDQGVQELEDALSHLAEKTAEATGTDYAQIPGSGAAGGLGFGLAAFAGGRIRSGIEAVLELINFRRIIRNADLVITGEGSIDRQSAFGKTPAGVALAAKEFDIPVIAVAGTIGEGASALYARGIDGMISSFRRPMDLQESLAAAGVLIPDAAEDALRLFAAGRNSKTSHRSIH